MVMVPEQVLQRRLRFKDYKQLPDDQDYEIIEGRLYVAPRPRPQHQIVAGRFVAILGRGVQDRGLGVVVPDADLVIDARNTYISPDIMVFLGDRFASVEPQGWIRILPDLIIEVLSPSTEDYDRRTKRQTSAQLGLPHYWMADDQRGAIIECVLDAGGEYRERVVEVPEGFRPALFPELAIDLVKLFA